ncbi:aminotransferase class I/II-fold pyridoxal phosphate-dependent enzyme [Methylobacterium sp. A54F]
MGEYEGDPLSRSNAHFANPAGADLFDRLEAYAAWTRGRVASGHFPYARTLTSPPEPVASIGYLGGSPRTGINLAVQDYLGLTAHEAIREAAVRTIRDFGIHSAGSAMLLGNNPYSLKLEADLADLVQMDHVLLFPTGWGAGYGLIRGLIRERDHVVLDALVQGGLQEGAAAATRNVHRFRHLSSAHAREILQAIRETDRENAILVVTQGLSAMDSDIPDLRSLLDACRAYGARLVVDVAHDLGALGPGGTGTLGTQGLLGQVDLVVGSFSKTFASNGGFVATNDARAKDFLRWFAGPHAFSSALSPLQCAVVSRAVEIVRSDAGRALRLQLVSGSKLFRQELARRGCTVLGSPSAIVPVLIGREAAARVAGRHLNASGTVANTLEFPAVGLGRARFRCQLMATHSGAQLGAAAEAIAGAIAVATAGSRGQGLFPEAAFTD